MTMGLKKVKIEEFWFYISPVSPINNRNNVEYLIEAFDESQLTLIAWWIEPTLPHHVRTLLREKGWHTDPLNIT